MFFLIIIFFLASFIPDPFLREYYSAINAFLALGVIIAFFKKRNLFFSRSDFYFWGFVIFIGVNIFFSHNKDIALKTYLNLAFPLLLIYYLIKNAIVSNKQFVLLAKVISLCSCLVSLGGIFEAFFSFNPLYEYFIKNNYYIVFVKGLRSSPPSLYNPGFIAGFVHPISTQFHPTVLATYLLASLPFSFFLYKCPQIKYKVLGIINLILSLPLIILTFSRGVVFGLIAMVGLYLFALKRYFRLLIFFILLFLSIILCTFLPHPFERYGMAMLSPKGEGILAPYRHSRVKMVFDIFKEHPFVGIGLGNFREKFYEYFPEKRVIPEEFKVVDNMYLAILAETGLIGFSGLFIFIAAFLYKAYRKLKKMDLYAHTTSVILFILMAFLGLLFAMLGYELFYWPGQYYIFCLIVGLLAVYSRIPRVNSQS